MKNKIWVDIVQLKEFVKYFSTKELIELSMSSKLFRPKLIPAIFKKLEFGYSNIVKFDYESYIITEGDSEYNDKYIQDTIKSLIRPYRRGNIYSDYSDYSDYSGDIEDRHYEEFEPPSGFFINPCKPLTEKFIASREKFQSDLNLIPYQPSELMIHDFSDHCYLIRELPIKFNNLKALHILRTKVLLEDLQYLFDNLKCLEELLLVYNCIFKCKSEIVDFSIKWPHTLKKLIFRNNSDMLLDNKQDPFPIYSYNGDSDIPTTQHLLLPTRLPNLESLSLKPSFGKFDDKLEFLKANPHIKKLSLPFVEEIPQVFDTIKSFNNLEHLDIFSANYSFPEILGSINFPIPSNLKSLNLSSLNYNDIIKFINNPLLQVTNLQVKFENICFNELLLFVSNISCMQSLKKLKLIFESIFFELGEATGYNFDNSFRTNVIKFSNFNDLKSVEFKFELRSLNFVKMDLSKLKLSVIECPKLKCIEFKRDSKVKYFGEIGSDKLGLDDNWKLISTPYRYLLHKVGQ